MVNCALLQHTTESRRCTLQDTFYPQSEDPAARGLSHVAELCSRHKRQSSGAVLTRQSAVLTEANVAKKCSHTPKRSYVSRNVFGREAQRCTCGDAVIMYVHGVMQLRAFGTEAALLTCRSGACRGQGGKGP
uniref:Uncharacterized protein n=1 Tax=Haptolina brevifila TaxID=156173 RepID=A0A6U7MY78_9EUKA|mmetsp:Transcript_82361/g.164162  ORF Transcript_82361/g.164162 Transcript_82361/m.164162 type:complete len:132 (+) Transcript_82361:809-1204(+)